MGFELTKSSVDLLSQLHCYNWTPHFVPSPIISHWRLAATETSSVFIVSAKSKHDIENITLLYIGKHHGYSDSKQCILARMGGCMALLLCTQLPRVQFSAFSEFLSLRIFLLMLLRFIGGTA